MSGREDRANPLAGAGAGLTAALTIRFLLELVLLGAAATAGWGLLSDPWRWVAVFAAPVLIAVIWGLLLAPRARFVVPEWIKVVVEALLFVATGAGLWLLGAGILGIVLVAAWALDRVAIDVLRRRRA